MEETLAPNFSALIQFVNECEPLAEQGHAQLLGKYTGGCGRANQQAPGKVVQIIRAFGAEWKRGIEGINKEVLQSFTNFKNGTVILQTAFTQFVNYYERFNKILYNAAFESVIEARAELVGAPVIIAELKKYKPVY